MIAAVRRQLAYEARCRRDTRWFDRAAYVLIAGIVAVVAVAVAL